MLRSPYASDAIAAARDIGLSIGLHLDFVTHFVQDRSPLFGPHGKVCQVLFAHEIGREGPMHFSCFELIKVRDEMRCQIDDFIKLSGSLPSHLDYHYGLHHLSVAMALYLTIAEEYQLPVRWGEQYAGSNPYRLAPMAFCDQFHGQEQGGVELFLSMVDQPCDGTKEIVCHPGFTTPGILPEAYNHGRELELRTLTDTRLKEQLEQRQALLVNYDWLKAHILSKNNYLSLEFCNHKGWSERDGA